MMICEKEKYPLGKCPICGAEEMIEENKDNEILSIGLHIETLFPRNAPGVIQYVRCMKCGYEGPIVWCKNGFSRKIIAEAWKKHLFPLENNPTSILIRELQKREGVEQLEIPQPDWNYKITTTYPDEIDTPSLTGDGPAIILVVRD